MHACEGCLRVGVVNCIRCIEEEFHGNATADGTEPADAGSVRALREMPALQKHPSSQVCVYLDWTERRLRAAAEASRGRVLSAPGQVGYRLAETTPVESYYSNERMRYLSQIRVMQRRLSQMDAAVHGARRE